MTDTHSTVTKICVEFSGRQEARLYTTSNGQPICPVCYTIWTAPNAEPAWIETGEQTSEGLPLIVASWSICGCCNTQFGNDDIPDDGESLDVVWLTLREKWLARRAIPNTVEGELVSGVTLNFPHHLVMKDLPLKLGKAVQHTLTLETLTESFLASLEDLEQQLILAGYEKTGEKNLDEVMMLTFKKSSPMSPERGSVRIHARAYKSVGEGVHEASTGQLTITVQSVVE